MNKNVLTKADEMFKELGYKRPNTLINDELKSFKNEYIKVVPFDEWSNNIFKDKEFQNIVDKHKLETEQIFIIFDYLFNSIEKKVKIGNEYYNAPITLVELEAINQRIKELGWLK